MDNGMLTDIIVVVIIAIICGINIFIMANNVKNGRSIDGCNGDCSHCSMAKRNKVHGKRGKKCTK